jgi:hypothetical protein
MILASTGSKCPARSASRIPAARSARRSTGPLGRASLGLTRNGSSRRIDTRPVKARIRPSASPSAAATDEDKAAKAHTSISRKRTSSEDILDTVFDSPIN